MSLVSAPYDLEKIILREGTYCLFVLSCKSDCYMLFLLVVIFLFYLFIEHFF